MTLEKRKQRLIKEMLYGIQASKDVKLSNIARTLKEKQSLIKTKDRIKMAWRLFTPYETILIVYDYDNKLYFVEVKGFG